MDIANSKFINEIKDTAENMYRLGWNERNGGNISVLLKKEEIEPYLPEFKEKRKLKLSLPFEELAGKYFVITGTGRYFKNIKKDPETNLGIIRISDDGTYASLLWGYKEGGTFTSEIVMHLNAHIQRIKAGDDQRAVIHAHPANTVAMTHIHSWDEKEFTMSLWSMITECIVIFPEGVAVLPWMISSSDNIGIESAKKFKNFKILIWAMHGITAAGSSLDEVFGLIETVEKAAQIYIKTSDCPQRKGINKAMLKDVAAAFGLEIKNGWLD